MRAWRWLPLAVLALVTLGVLISGAPHLLDLDRLLAARISLHEFVEADRARALVLAALGYVGATLVSMPATLVLTALCGLLFGTLTGALLAVCSATTGAVIVFAVGRFAARDLLERKAGPRLGRFAEGFRRDAFGYVAVMRILPLFPFWLTNLAPAACGVRLPTFALATFFGLLPGAFVYAATGAGIEEVVGAHEAARAACRARGETGCEAPLTLFSFVTPGAVVALGLLAVAAILGIIVRQRLERRAATL